MSGLGVPPHPGAAALGRAGQTDGRDEAGSTEGLRSRQDEGSGRGSGGEGPGPEAGGGLGPAGRQTTWSQEGAWRRWGC